MTREQHIAQAREHLAKLLHFSEAIELMCISDPDVAAEGVPYTNISAPAVYTLIQEVIELQGFVLRQLDELEKAQKPRAKADTLEAAPADTAH